MPLSAGAHLGPYEIQAPLGSGGMGEVYCARDSRLERTVAIKVLPPNAQHSDALERFRSEARVLSRLSHPHICALYDIGEEDGVAFLVMEYLEGETLADRLESGPLPLEQALRHAHHIATALDEAHRQGVVHRDLKPGNIMLTRAGVKVLDFGLAKLREQEGEAGSQVATGSFDLTAEGVLVGTLRYMAPEQVEGRPADARTDIFAFGAVLYEMVTGMRPFKGNSRASLIAAILASEPEPLSTLRPMAPPLLDRVVQRCLAKDPEERWQTARDLAAELMFILESGSQAGLPAPEARRRRGRSLLAGGLLGATLVTGVLVALVARGPEAPTPSVELIRFAVTLPPGASLEVSPVGTTIALSPDGRQVAFVAAAAGRLTRLWLRSLDALSAQPLEGTENAVSPFWSPDGRFLAFFSEGKLRKIPAQGGPPETLCDSEFATSGTWNAEGTILFSQFTGPKAGLWRISASGGSPARVETDAGDIESWPQFLPDGRHFLFLTGAYGGQGAQNLLHAGSLDAPVSERLMPTDSRATYVAGGRLIFARDGSLMSVPFDASRRTIGGEATPFGEPVSFLRTTGSALFSASSDGRTLVYVPLGAPSQLTWLDRAGRPAGTVGDPARLFGVRLSPDGKKAVFHIFDLRKGAQDIWVDDLERGLRSRLTTDPRDAMFPIWDPRGERIVFASARRGPPQLYVRGSEASGEERLLLDVPGVRFARDWSPDGKRIVLEDFAPDRRVRHQLWVLTLGPPARLAPFAHGPANKYHPRFSPDGRHLAFTSEETGRPEVVVASLDGTSHRQVSSEGGLLPRWRGDGQELFYLTPLGELVSVSLTPGLHPAIGGRRPLFWLRVGPSGGMSQGAPPYGPDYDVTADGQRFLFSLGAESAQGSFVALLGWQRAVRP